MNQGLPGERVRGADSSGRPTLAAPPAPIENVFAPMDADRFSAAEPSMGQMP